MAKSTETPQEHTFETAIGALEKLVEEMESEDLPLEQLIVNYEEGTKLVKICQTKLSEAEKKIEIIQRKAGGDLELKPLDPDSKPEPAAQPRRPSAKDANLF